MTNRVYHQGSGLPLHQGKEFLLAKKENAAASTESHYIHIDSDSALFALYVDALDTGATLTVEVFTYIDEGKEVSILKFPTITGPTANLLLKKIATTMPRIRIEITWTGLASFQLRCRGLAAGESTARILGPAKGKASQQTVGVATQLLIPASSQDRISLIILNNNAVGTLYLGFTAAEATSSIGYPIGPGGQLGIDLEAGAEIYAVGSVPIDVRILEAIV